MRKKSGLNLEKVQSTSLADRARDMIRSAIFDGRVAPNEKLTIEHIAAELGISRTPVREALKSLESDGILKLMPNRGAIVQRFERDDIADRYTVRAALEGLAGELACRNRADDLSAQLSRNCRLIEKALRTRREGDLHVAGELVLLNSQFHGALLEAANSPTVSRMLETLQMPVSYRMYTWRSSERAHASLSFHNRIVEALKARKPFQVRSLLEEHILEARDFLMNSDGVNMRPSHPVRQR